MQKATAEQRVEAIAEAMPFIKRYRGRRIVVKIGGSVLVDDSLLHDFARDVSLLTLVGIELHIVHGGGPQIGVRLKEEGIPERKAKGLRITDEKTLAVVEEVLCGTMNKRIVDAVVAAGSQAVGLSGKDNRLLQAKVKVDPEVDFGLVGTIDAVNTAAVNALGGAAVPVIAPLGASPAGDALNVNADEAAAALAVALGCEALLLLTDTDGVYGSDGKMAPRLTVAQIDQLLADGVISEGMVPKVDCALSALAGGVPTCRILNGKISHAMLLELLTDKGAGTLIAH